MFLNLRYFFRTSDQQLVVNCHEGFFLDELGRRSSILLGGVTRNKLGCAGVVWTHGETSNKPMSQPDMWKLRHALFPLV